MLSCVADADLLLMITFLVRKLYKLAFPAEMKETNQALV